MSFRPSRAAGLHEPGGLALGDGLVYVADTNAHRVVVVSEGTDTLEELEIALPTSRRKPKDFGRGSRRWPRAQARIRGRDPGS